MFQFTFTLRNLSVLSLTLALSLIGSQSAWAQQAGTTLHGGVNMSGQYNSTGPGLNRSAMVKPNDDPFSNAPASEQFDPGTFDTPQQDSAPPPPKPFNLNAQDQGEFQGAPMNGMNGGQVPQIMNQQMLAPPQQGNINDPDNSQHMQVQWELWHRRVAEAIFVRFDALAQKAFATSRPIACQAVYTVTRDRQITNVRLTQKSPNVVFNSMLLLVLKSMNGNPILEFPPGSRRQFVEKGGTFSRNYGVQGFKYTTGDQETINQNGGQR